MSAPTDRSETLPVVRAYRTPPHGVALDDRDTAMPAFDRASHGSGWRGYLGPTPTALSGTAALPVRTRVWGGPHEHDWNPSTRVLSVRLRDTDDGVLELRLGNASAPVAEDGSFCIDAAYEGTDGVGHVRATGRVLPYARVRLDELQHTFERANADPFTGVVSFEIVHTESTAPAYAPLR